MRSIQSCVRGLRMTLGTGIITSLSIFVGIPPAMAGPQLTAVLTYHGDNTRQGANTNETLLTPANVNTNSFGLLFTKGVDGVVYAQPLVMPNVAIPGQGTHTVVFVATEHDTVYAFDADSNTGSNSTPLWTNSFINPGAGITTVPSGDTGSGDISLEIGISATPVIDAASGTIYVEAKTKEVTGSVTSYVHRLHALDITTGRERTNFNSPGVLTAPGWNDLRQHDRAALTLVNGIVYMAYASHGDNGPYNGWVLAYNATNVAQQVAVFNCTATGSMGGFWDGGGGAAVDAGGNLYLQSGNGTFDGVNNFAMSVLKLSTTNGLARADYFAPYNEATLNGGDQDLGSGASIVLPDSAGSVAHPHLLVAAGKSGEGLSIPDKGKIYLLDRDNMGQFNAAGDTQIVQALTNAIGGSYSTPAFWNNTLYYGAAKGDTLKAFTMSGGLIQTPPVQAPAALGGFGATPVISANGTSNGIVWLIQANSPAVLHAYNATNIALELYNSSQILGRDNPGSGVKFSAPAVANGKVYMGTMNSLAVFGGNSSNAIFVPSSNTFTVNFSVGPGNANPYSGQGAYGGDPSNSFWNLAPGVSGTASGAALSSSLAATPITMTLNYGFNNSGLPNGNAPNGSPGYLLGSENAVNGGSPGIGTGANPEGQFILNHVPQGSYSLYLYAANFDGDRGSVFTLNATNGGVADGGTNATVNGSVVGLNAIVLGHEAFAEGDNYIFYHNVTPDAAGAITGTYVPNPNPISGNNGEAPFNGLQLALHLISITNAPAGNVTVTWSGGALQSATNLSGPWTNMPGTSPLTIPATGAAQYFKVF